MNTFIVGISIAVAQVVFSAIAGFAFAKLNFRGRKFFILFIVGTMMLPSQLGIIPLFMLVKNLQMIDTLYALIVPALVTAFGVFWMRQIIDAQVPNELLEAAGIAHLPCLAWNGQVLSMSMPHPALPTADSFFQAGHKSGSFGKLLPGWYVEKCQLMPLGIPWPENLEIDAECFVVPV